MAGLMAGLTMTTASAQSPDWYVDADASAGGTGDSWSQAFDDLQDAFDAADPGHVIWVRAATNDYVPSDQDPFGTGSEDVTFLIPDGVRVYGGFDGTENQFTDRAELFGKTVLSGALASGNARHVVTFRNIGWGNHPVILDGFKIEDGDADSDLVTHGNQGGGILFLGSNARIQNCRIRDNSAKYGGGLYAAPTSSNECGLELLRCRWIANQAGEDGGAMAVEFSSGTQGDQSTFYAWNQVVRLNQASLGDGGGLWLELADDDFVTLCNWVVYDNEAERGGGIFLDELIEVTSNGRLDLSHLTAAYNHANDNAGGGGLYVSSGSWPSMPAEVSNSIFWGNTSEGTPTTVDSINGPGDSWSSTGAGYLPVVYSDVEGSTSPPSVHAGSGNLNTDPLFVNGATRKLRLTQYSPVCDACDDGRTPLDTLDMDDDTSTTITPLDAGEFDRELPNPWVTDTGTGTGANSSAYADMGAYEYDSAAGGQ